MFTWANATGDVNDTNGGHRNRFFHLKQTSERSRVLGVKMYHEGLSHANVIKVSYVGGGGRGRGEIKD